MKHFDGNSVARAEAIAIATVNEETVARQLIAAALAADLEDEPLWLVDAKTLDCKLAREYGNSLMVLWRTRGKRQMTDQIGRLDDAPGRLTCTAHLFPGLPGHWRRRYGPIN